MNKMNKEEMRRYLVFDTLEDLSPDRQVLVHNYIVELENNWNELKELLKQPVPTYASAIKLLDEIEKIIESKGNND